MAPAADHIQPPEGSLDIQTESTDQYQRHSQVQRQKRVVIKDGIDGPTGKINHNYSHLSNSSTCLFVKIDFTSTV